MAELALEDAERTLDFGAHLGDNAGGPLVEGMQLVAFGALHMAPPCLAGRRERGLALDTDIALVGSDQCFLVMKD